MNIIPADQRGSTRISWLDSKHVYSFGNWYEPTRMGHGPLRVLNDDHVAPGGGFGTHPHREMEIVSWVLEGGLEHKDSTGAGSVLRPGTVQRMSAGTGVTHSEFNTSNEDEVHFLQIWIVPAVTGLPPAYDEHELELVPGAWSRLVGPEGDRSAPISIRQNAAIDVVRLDAGQEIDWHLGAGRQGMLYVAKGSITLGSELLATGDQVEVSVDDARDYQLSANAAAEVLVFDLPNNSINNNQ